MSMLPDGLLGELIGRTSPTQYDCGREKQQNFNPFEYQRLQAQYPQMTPMEQYILASTMQGMVISPPRKVVKSRILTPEERARKAINGAVQAVKDAQEKA